MRTLGEGAEFGFARSLSAGHGALFSFDDLLSGPADDDLRPEVDEGRPFSAETLFEEPAPVTASQGVPLDTDSIAVIDRAYEEELDKMLDDPRFTERMIKWWKDTMRVAGGANGDAPSRNTAPNLAARITVEGRPFSDLFTQSSGNCPEYDGDTKTFVDGDCDSGALNSVVAIVDPSVGENSTSCPSLFTAIRRPPARTGP